MDCFVNGCTEKASEICFTCEVKTLMCLKHASDHMRVKKNHDVQEFLMDFGEENVKNICENVGRVLRELNDCRNKLNENVALVLRKVYEEYYKCLRYFRNLEINLIEVAKNVRNFNQKILKVDLNLLKNLKLGFDDLIKESEIELIKVPAFSEPVLSKSVFFYEQVYFSEEFSKGLRMVENFSELYKLSRHKDLFFFEEKIAKEPELQLIYPNDKEIRIIDLESLVSEVLVFDNVRPLQGASAVQVYENSVWFYSFESKANLFNIKYRTSKVLPNSRRNYYARGCIYYDNTIYLFGGVGGSSGQIQVREAEQYSFINEQWKELSLLPSVLKGTSAKLIDSNIYIVGFAYKSLLEYNRLTGKYSELIKLNDSPRSKIFCGNFIIMNKSKVIWHVLGTQIINIELEQEVLCDSLAISSTVENEKYIYYIIWDGKLMRFNKSTYKQEVLINRLP